LAKSQELFELHFDGDTVYQGEQLYDAGAVQEILKPEKSLWTAMVYDETFYEVELFSPFAQRRKVSCECKDFLKDKACKHITAALFALRTQLKEEAERKAERLKNKTSTGKKLNINTLLQELDKDDLINFIRGYARKDKNFNIALKAHFARRVDLVDNRAKFKGILDSIIKPITSPTTRAKAADLKNFINVSKELTSQLEDALSLSDYTDAFYIVDAGISKAEYVRYHYDNYADETLAISQRYHRLLILLHQRVHADELKSSLLELIIDLPQRSYYRHNRLEDHLYYLLIDKQNKDKDLMLRIRHICTDTLLIKKIEERDFVTILSLILILDYHLYKLKDISWFVEQHAQLSMNVVDRLVSVSQSEVSVQLMKKMKTHFPKSRELKRKLLQVHLSLDQISDLVKLLPKYVIQSDDTKMLYKLRSTVSSEQWTDIILELIAHYKTQPNKKSILASLYFHEEDYDSLIELMHTGVDLDLVMNYDHKLYKEYSKDILDIYKKVLSTIIDSYLGDRSQTSVKKALYHLETLGARKIQRDVTSFLKSEYKHRIQYLL